MTDAPPTHEREHETARDELLVTIERSTFRAEVYLEESIRAWKEVLAQHEALMHMEPAGSPLHTTAARLARTAGATIAGLRAMHDGTFSMLLSVLVPASKRLPVPVLGLTPPPDQERF